MAKRRRKRKKSEDEHTILGIKVTNFDASIDGSINYELRQDIPIFVEDDDLALIFETMLKIEGVCTYPPERAKDTYEITVIGSDRNPRQFSATLKDFQVRDEDGIPKYRRYRGEDYPVYEAPKGMARIEKRRGTRTWDCWIWVKLRMTSDMLTLLGQERPLFLIPS